MKFSKCVFSLCIVIAVVFLAFSLSSVDFEYFSHCCTHKDCPVCAVYGVAQMFNFIIVLSIFVNLVVLCIRNYCKKIKYKCFKLLPVELKVRLDD